MNPSLLWPSTFVIIAIIYPQGSLEIGNGNKKQLESKTGRTGIADFSFCIAIIYLASLCRMKAQNERERLPSFISKQVKDSRHFFLNLDPKPSISFEIVCGGVEQVSRDYQIKRDNFPFYAIEFVASGEGTLHISGRTHQLSSGSIYAYGPAVDHQISNTGQRGMKKYYLDLSGTKVAPRLQAAQLQTSQRGYTPIWTKDVIEMEAVFELLIDEAQRNRSLALPICHNLVELIFLKIQQLQVSTEGPRSKAYDTYESVCQYIDRNFLELHTASEIAQACDLSPMYLSRLFKRFSSSGCYHYLLQRKMNHAAELLLGGKLLVSEVAEKLAFPDAFQFSRSFKRIYGYPPSKLTQTNRHS